MLLANSFDGDALTIVEADVETDELPSSEIFAQDDDRLDEDFVDEDSHECASSWTCFTESLFLSVGVPW
jgi:hypothetical protein